MRRLLLFLALFLQSRLFAQPILVCFGDSLTAGYGLDEEQAYPALLQERLPEWKVINAGVSGDTTAGGLKRVAWVLRAKPRAVFIALGANDGLRGVDPAETEKNLCSMIEAFRKAGSSVYLAGMMIPTNYGPEYFERFRALFPTVAIKEKVPLMPFLLEGVAGIASLNQADGIHPTPEGAAIVAKHVYAFLKPKLQGLEKP